MLRALQQSRATARDACAKAVTEANLRADLSLAVLKRDEAVSAATEHQRKAALLQEELRDTKLKLSRATQEKLKLERDSRATLSLARSLDSHKSSGGTEYYQRKVTELTGQVQSLQATLAEKQRQIDELTRQLHRNLSQNRLENLKKKGF